MNQKHFPDQICVGSDKLSVWNLSTPSPDNISPFLHLSLNNFVTDCKQNQRYISENQSY